MQLIHAGGLYTLKYSTLSLEITGDIIVLYRSGGQGSSSEALQSGSEWEHKNKYSGVS